SQHSRTRWEKSEALSIDEGRSGRECGRLWGSDWEGAEEEESMALRSFSRASAVSTERQKAKSRHYMPFLANQKQFSVGEKKMKFLKTSNFRASLRKLG
ncbi:MAG: hypothetical protein ABIG11_01435, partial [bacterium]